SDSAGLADSAGTSDSAGPAGSADPSDSAGLADSAGTPDSEDPSDSEADALLRKVASLETASEHPLAAAIVAAARERGLELSDPEDFYATGGRGAEAVVDGELLLVGNAAFMAEQGMELGGLAGAAARMAAEAQTPVYVGSEGRVLGVIGIADPVKPSSAGAIAVLKALGMDVVMLTGDTRATAEAIARQVGVDRVVAEVLPKGKVEEVERLRAEGRKVAMVGDGLNDAPALATADIGIAIGTGTDVALEASDITLMGGDLNGVPDAIRLSRRTMRVIRQNLFWAFIYNIIGIPIAAGVLYPVWGILLSPVIGSAAMAFSSVSVVTNSLRLRRFPAARSARPAPGAAAA
ncbi:MAG: HAD-IC family P-type ATPase, partial [Gemmatimonadota bacterium]